MKRIMPFLFFLASLSLLHLTSVAVAQSVFRGPQSSAMGGAGLAGVEDLEGVFLNPAEIALLKSHAVGVYFRDGYEGLGQHRHAYGVGVGDNGPDVMFPGSLHYLRLRDTGLAPLAGDGELWHAAIGEMVLPNLAFGLSVYRLTYKFKGEADAVQWNGSVGAIWEISKELGVAYVLNNLVKPGSSVPEGLRQDLQQGVGMFAEVAEIANLRLDITRNETRNVDHKLVYMGAFESMSGKFAVFRTGYRLDDQQDERFWTVGMGYNGPRLKVDYSFEKNLRGTSGALHSVDLRLPF